MKIDTRLKSYWAALRGLRGASTPSERATWLNGPFKLAISLEKDPRLREHLVRIHEQETTQPA